ncbi:MAG: folylpolyglutamate synthase/dihydrofolate synthase family protein, partial [Halobacteriales archaeon]|nr:folylpolyglutamate synthase/dihydrofolate synthase family protein [Halobacteriales archaeon]
MEYFEAANFLFDLRRFRMKPGTKSTARLLEHLGNPQTDLTAVQIAGTNGKGSTAGMVESILREAGLGVGLYTSPHMDDVRDRIKVNGHPMPKADVVAFVERVREYVTDRAAQRASPTFFEVLTAMALDHFATEGVDVAVLEVGIGGRHDATSVVSPITSAVTNVSLEHTELLGDTVNEIARDKSSVAPDDGPLVTGATGEALEAVKEATGSVLTVGEGADADVQVRYRGVPDQTRPESAIEIAGPDWSLETRMGLCGRHQARNAGVAACLARQVAAVDRSSLAVGLRRAHWPGRFEILDPSPLTVLDGAHNPGACDALAETLAEFTYENLILVFGALFDKDHPEMARTLPTPDQVIIT